MAAASILRGFPMIRIPLLSDEERALLPRFRETALRTEADRDLARRSLVVVASYFLIWLIIYYTAQPDELNVTLLEFLGFLLLASGVERYYLGLNFSRLYAAHPRQWRWLFTGGTLLAAASWSSVCLLALNYSGFGTTTLLVLLATAGLAAGGIVSLAPAPWLGGIFILVLLSPTVEYAWEQGSLRAKPYALIFMTFLVFMFFLWRRLHVEYWQGLIARAELVRAKETAEAATRAKAQFIASVSHELRTPLTSIIGSLNMVNSYPELKVAGEAKTLIDLAYRNGKRLSELINDLLDYEKLSAQRMSFKREHIALSPFLARAVELNQPYAAGHQVTLAFDPPQADFAVVADDHRLMQVMTNLLSNAAKHSPAGSRVIVSAAAVPAGVRVSVRDQGPGVPEDFRQHVFQHYAQAEGAGRVPTGTGLGLAICKAIVEQLGGRIGFDSAPGQGATFHVELPLAAAASAASAGGRAPS